MRENTGLDAKTLILSTSNKYTMAQRTQPPPCHTHLMLTCSDMNVQWQFTWHDPAHLPASFTALFRLLHGSHARRPPDREEFSRDCCSDRSGHHSDIINTELSGPAQGIIMGRHFVFINFGMNVLNGRIWEVESRRKQSS